MLTTVCIYQPAGTGKMWHKVNYKRGLTGFNSEFSFYLTDWITKVEETSLLFDLPITG